MYIKVHGLRKGVNIKGGTAVKEYARRVDYSRYSGYIKFQNQ